MNENGRRLYRALMALLLVAMMASLGVVGCSSEDDDPEDDVGPADVSTDEDTSTEEDVAQEDVTADTGPDDLRGEPVEIDLSAYVGDAPEPDGVARVVEITDAADLVTGAAATGRVGDYLLENDHVRFVVQQDERTVGPCPWGGTIIDAERRVDGFGGDILSELCLFINADQTFKPESFEVVEEGTEGAAVLAVTGRTALLDYLNVEAMIAGMGGGFADLFVMKPDDLLPLTITTYYILRPGDRGVRTVTAIRNDGDEHQSLVLSQLFVSGADGSYFNPLGETGGFGYIDRGLADPDPDRLPFVALLSEASGVAYFPEADERLEADLPIAGAYLTIFNVVASVLGRTDIITTLLMDENQLRSAPGVHQLEPGDVTTLKHWVFVGDGDLSSMTDEIYEKMLGEVGRFSGEVVDADGEPVEGARVSAVDGQGRTMNQAMTDEAGAYAMNVPGGTYDVIARAAEHFSVDPAVAAVAAGETATVPTLVTEAAGRVAIEVSTPDGSPTPARVTLRCQGNCPNKATANERDISFDGLPEQWATVEWVGMSGTHEFPVAAGTYRVVVSRGMEWSLWPEDVEESGGHLIEVEAGQTVSLDAEIAHVVDASGALSADFHVHSLSSLDSTTPHLDRILTFLTEGVDVVVSSDHDEIVDYGPAAQQLGVMGQLVTLVGSEVTTIDLGHFNSFPLEVDEEDRRGGALDWAGGEDLALGPEAIYEWMRSFPDEQVVQINHPDSSYLRFSDVLRGITYGDPARMRVQTPDYDEESGDTGLWSDDFTAMELMNGPRMERFWGVTRWWLTLIGRGHRAAGTGVTDTHVRYGRVLGGVPRTYVYGQDDLGAFSTVEFVESVNEQRVVATNGPFVRVRAIGSGGETAGLGETLETGGEPVTFEVTIEVPEWVHVDRVEMVMNDDSVVTEPGEYDTEPIAPTETYPVEFGPDDLEVVATGDAEHRRYRKVVEITVDVPEDAYVVFMVRGSQGMYPVLPDDEIMPFALTNPIYLDVDGNGYVPHLASAAQSSPPGMGMMIGAGEEEISRDELMEQLLEIQKHLPNTPGQHTHPHGHHHPHQPGHHHHHH